ncbi:MAG: sugar phosphate isomerase/epimerase [Bacteroidetes bacterium]|nr:sugar phosphate isomerase/epimerase [Bacteroidota bacterium]
MANNKGNNDFNSRREFLLKGTMASLGLMLSRSNVWAKSILLQDKPNSKIAGVQIGVITYSYRSMPGDIHQILKDIVDSGISATELMGNEVEEYAGKPVKLGDDKDYDKKVADWRAAVSMEKFEEVRKMFNEAGVSIYAFKPDALNEHHTDAEIEYAMKVAKTLGANSVTVELPKNKKHSKRLGVLAEKNKVYVGYHAHTQATDTAWDTALSQSPYNSMNLDCGHYIAAGGNNTKETLLALIQAKHDRITSMHLKDRKSKDHGGENMPWGEGDTPIADILNLLKDKKYAIPCSIELEYDIPAGSDAVKETRRCFEFAKKALGA